LEEILESCCDCDAIAGPIVRHGQAPGETGAWGGTSDSCLLAFVGTGMGVLLETYP
jgi:hypothetical protein